nr:capsid [Terfezia claveryi partitivirus 1]
MSAEAGITNPLVPDAVPTPLAPPTGTAQAQRPLLDEAQREQAPTGPTSRPPRTFRPLTTGTPFAQPDVTAPQDNDFFAQRMNLHQRTAAGINFPVTLYAQPDTRAFLYACISFVSSTFGSLNFSAYQLVTPQTLIAYFMYVFYARLLLQDLQCRQPSFYANRIRQDNILMSWIMALSQMAIPSELQNLYERLSVSNFSGNRDVHVIPSLGAYSLAHDLIRTIPPSAFIIMHNTIITTTTLTEDAVQRALFNEAIITLDTTTYRLNNFIAMFYNVATDNANVHRFSTWLNQSTLSLQVPYTQRYEMRRPLFRNIRFTAPTCNPISNATFNPYIWLLALDATNLLSTQQWVNELHTFVHSQFTSAIALEDTLGKPSDGTLHHALFPLTLPTGTTNVLTMHNTITAGTRAGFATSIQFGSGFRYPGNATTVANPTTAGAHFRADLYLFSTDETSTPVTAATYSDAEHFYNQIALVSPTPDSVNTHYRTLLSGMVIETSNIDGFTFPTYNPHLTPQMNKDKFLSVAIPTRFIRNGVDPILTFRRDMTYPSPGNVTVSLYQAARNFIRSYVAQSLVTPRINHIEVISGFNGQSPYSNQIAISTPDTAISRAPTQRIIDLWSSYRYVLPGTTSLDHTCYFFPSLEHLFGHDGEIVASEQLFRVLLS